MKGYIKAFEYWVFIEYLDGLAYRFFNNKKRDKVELLNYESKIGINSKKIRR